MTISIICPACDVRLRVRDDLAGQKVKCPHCGEFVLVAEEEELPAEGEERPGQAGHRPREAADADDEVPRPRRGKKRKAKSGHGLLYALLGGVSALVIVVVTLVIVLARGGEGERAVPDAPPVGVAGGPAAGARPFMDKRKTVPAGLEWNVGIIARKSGPISYRITSQGPISILLVAERSYRALQGKNQEGIHKEDLLVDIVSPVPTYEGRVTLPPGRFYFIIENQSRMQVEMHLECFAN